MHGLDCVCEYKLSLHKFTNDVLWSIACHILYYTNNNNNISDRTTLTVCVGFVVAFIITLTHIRTAQRTLLWHGHGRYAVVDKIFVLSRVNGFD